MGLTLAAAACGDDYDDTALWDKVNNHEERLAALEKWQAETNTNIQALQTLLSTTDYITAVTPVLQEGVEVGFTISFLNTPAITIYHGTKGDKGDTPQIGAAQGDDGNWYWTLNGELLTDADGNSIQANAPLPQLATGTKLTDRGITTDTQNNTIVTDAIYLSVDGGTTWTRVSGEKGDTGDTGATGEKGDYFFKDVKIDDDYVTFILADGITEFSVPRYVKISLTFNPTSASLLYGQTTKIQCIVTGSSTADDLYLIAVPDGWKAVINSDLTLTVTAPATDSTGEILVMLDNKKGSTTIGRIRVKTAGGIVGTVLKADGLASGQIATLIGSRTDLTSVVLTNCNLSSQDWNAISKNKSLETIDLGESTYNSNSFSYVGNIIGNSTLQSLTVPAGVRIITTRGFYECTKLTTVTIPASVEQIQSSAFKYCEKMTTFDIPEDSKLTKIGYEAFACCYKLESIFIPATVKTIDKSAFNICRSLKSVTFAEGSQLTEIPYFCFASNKALTAIEIPPLVTTLGESVFEGCAMLATITFPAGVTSIGKRAFSGCTSLTTVTCLAEIPPTLSGETPSEQGKAVFYGCTALTNIYVPAGSVDAYKAADGWSNYAEKISAIPEP